MGLIGDSMGFKRIHFTGIGGVSMSALAEISSARGILVTGSDISENEHVETLRSKGITIYTGHFPQNVDGAEALVYTAAVKTDNPELVRARELGIPVIERASFLGDIMKGYKNAICVAGTHGKTTTTSILSEILIGAGLDPTVLIGGTLSSIGGNYRIGKTDYMVAEACEYVDSFLKFFPSSAIILNIEPDHLDYFTDGIEGVKRSFVKFAKLVPEGGFTVLNIDDGNVNAILPEIPGKIITVAVSDKDADYRAVLADRPGYPVFTIEKGETTLCEVELKVPGLHNVYNSLSAAACALEYGISPDDVARALGNFAGVHRRFELVGKIGDVTVVDDYAHHPSEIEATLNAARSLGFRRVITIFQPHTYTRTKALFDDFADVLSEADLAILTDIYAAREPDTLDISSEMLADAIPGARYCRSFDDAAELAAAVADEGDIVLTMGAGSVASVAPILLHMLDHGGE